MTNPGNSSQFIKNDDFPFSFLKVASQVILKVLDHECCLKFWTPFQENMALNSQGLIDVILLGKLKSFWSWTSDLVLRKMMTLI